MHSGGDLRKGDLAPYFDYDDGDDLDFADVPVYSNVDIIVILCKDIDANCELYIFSLLDNEKRSVGYLVWRGRVKNQSRKEIFRLRPKLLC